VAAAPPFPAELEGHPRYRVVGLLGQGGMGAVYKAEHLVMDRPVALKVIRPSLLSDTAAFARFRQEVKAAGKLAHPNIVTAHDADQAGDLHFLVMEYVEGQNLADYLRKKGQLPVVEACNYARQAAQGLQHAHERGMIHRDIKPQNLMRTPQGRIKILDFGLARFARNPDESTGPLTAQGVVMGTADYIAPEQTRDARRADIRSDIYSLGCTLYYLLSGRVPFPTGGTVEKMVQHAVDPPTPLAELRPELPARLVRVVEKMMAKDPARRYQTPIDVDEALAPFAPDVGTGLDVADVLPAQPVAERTPTRPYGAPLAEQTTEVHAPYKELGQNPPRRIPGGGRRRLIVAAVAALFLVCAVPVGLIFSWFVRVSRDLPPPFPRASFPKPAPTSVMTAQQHANTARWERAMNHIRNQQWDQAEAEWAKLVGNQVLGTLRLEWSDFYAEQSRWDRAIADQETVVARYAEAPPDPARDPGTFMQWVESYQRLAFLHLVSGDGPGYRTACERMRRQFANANHPTAIFHVTWACGAGPGAIDDPGQLAREAEKAFRSYRGSVPAGYYIDRIALGAILYRAGRFDAAVEHLQRGNAEKQWFWYWPFLTMAHYRLGHPEGARVWLRESAANLRACIKMRLKLRKKPGEPHFDTDSKGSGGKSLEPARGGAGPPPRSRGGPPREETVISLDSPRVA
jgi:tRNA A-37 threonylcarbamoyl transferase component Bud32